MGGPGRSPSCFKAWGPYHSPIPQYRIWHPRTSLASCGQASLRAYDGNSVGRTGTASSEPRTTPTKEVGGHAIGHISRHSDARCHDRADGRTLLPWRKDGMGGNSRREPPSPLPACSEKLPCHKDPLPDLSLPFLSFLPFCHSVTRVSSLGL